MKIKANTTIVHNGEAHKKNAIFDITVRDGEKLVSAGKATLVEKKSKDK